MRGVFRLRQSRYASVNSRAREAHVPASSPSAPLSATSLQESEVILLGSGTHRGTHAAGIPGMSGTHDPRNHAGSAQPSSSEWAQLGSNQRPPACETGSALRRCSRLADSKPNSPLPGDLRHAGFRRSSPALLSMSFPSRRAAGGMPISSLRGLCPLGLPVAAVLRGELLHPLRNLDHASTPVQAPRRVRLAALQSEAAAALRGRFPVAPSCSPAAPRPPAARARVDDGCGLVGRFRRRPCRGSSAR